MTDPKVLYFFKRFYRNIIKWWYVVYNPVARIISFSKEDEEYTKKLNHEKKVKQIERNMKICEAQGVPYTGETLEDLAREEAKENGEVFEESIEEECDDFYEPSPEPEPTPAPKVHIEDANYNETTGAFSGLYGQGPMDDSTKSALDEIMGLNKKKDSFEDLLALENAASNTVSAPASNEVTIPEDHAEVMKEANEIYERLMREAAEDEARKQAEIEAAKAAAGV